MISNSKVSGNICWKLLHPRALLSRRMFSSVFLCAYSFSAPLPYSLPYSSSGFRGLCFFCVFSIMPRCSYFARCYCFLYVPSWLVWYFLSLQHFLCALHLLSILRDRALLLFLLVFFHWSSFLSATSTPPARGLQEGYKEAKKILPSICFEGH